MAQIPHSLFAVSPIDGRYEAVCQPLKNYFSEYALVKYRVTVEIKYFLALCKIPLPELADFNKDLLPIIEKIADEFTPDDAVAIKNIEKTTNHDVKAVEYFIRQQFEQLNLHKYSEFIHFGLTSQDINNTATPLLLKDSMHQLFFPTLNALLDKLWELSDLWKDISMLARTHGQPASPTKLGKEIYVFYERLYNQYQSLNAIPFAAKFGGATGNFNAHHVAYPEISWMEFGNDFVNNKLGLLRSKTTTQIEHYDYLAAFCDNWKRMNTIFIDFCRDIWTYISMDYFKQQIKKDEVGSSAMPHKVNPIDFENAEGNLGIANALLEHLAAKLPISRLQRDLTDSTVLRNLGVPLAHVFIAIHSMQKGLGKIILNQRAINDDLEKNWVVVAEAVQTILRRYGVEGAYDIVKNLTRQQKSISIDAFKEFIKNLTLPDNIKQQLTQITPYSYTGIYNLKKLH